MENILNVIPVACLTLSVNILHPQRIVFGEVTEAYLAILGDLVLVL